MMKYRVWSPLLALSLLICSCTPRITTDILLTSPAQDPDSVTVYEVGDFVPNSAEVVGNIAVRDRGTTTKCKYDYVLALAKQRTAKCGGNALLLTEHRTPSAWSSTCHQLWGKMLLLKDRNVYYDSYNPVMEQVAREAAGRDVQAQRVARVSAAKPVPQNVVKLNVGASQMTSRIKTPLGSYKGKWGTDVQLMYEHFWKSNIGLVAVFDHAAFSFSGLGTLKSDFFGAGVGWNGMLSKLRYDCNYAVGYGHGNDGYDDQGGFGAFFDLGLELMLSQHVGLGIDLNVFSNRWKTPDGMQMEKNEFYGMQRYNLLGGLRFYF